MKLVRTEILVSSGAFSESVEWAQIDTELRSAIGRVVWPPGSDRFTIHPESGKRRREGNGVKPIKLEFERAVADYGWEAEQRLQIGDGVGAGKIDAIKRLPNGIFAAEWETGNVASSHRSINKLALGLVQGHILGGAVIVPTRRLARWLTDRIGNLEELLPYAPLWRHLAVDGVLVLYGVEQEAEDLSVPKIPKGTDGRAQG